MSTGSLRTGLAVLLVATCLAYAPALRNDFVWDDWPLAFGFGRADGDGTKGIGDIVGAPLLVDVRGTPLLAYYRPLVKLTYLVDGALWEHRPFGFHLTNLGLHCANVVVLFLFLRVLRCRRHTALAGAALFALHPVNAQPVMWISGRTDLLCTGFVLAALVLYAAARRRRSDGLPLTAFACMAAAFGAKEHAAFGPLAFVLIDMYEGVWSSTQRRPAAATSMAASFALVGAYALLRWVILAIGSTNWIERPTSLLPLAGTIAGIFLHALRRLVFPFPPVVEFDPLPFVAEPVALHHVLFIAATVVVVVGATWWFLAGPPRRPITVLPLLTIAAYLPVSNLAAFHPPVADRFLYGPCALFCGLAAVLLDRISITRVRLGTAVTVVCTVGAVALWLHAPVYRNDVSLFTKVVEQSPQLPLGYVALGDALWLKGRFVEAVAALEPTRELRPNVGPAHLARYLEILGETSRAESVWRQLIERFPSHAAVNRIRYARFLDRRGRFAEVLEQLATVEAAQGPSAQLEYFKLLVFERARRPRDAVDAGRAYLLLAPGGRHGLDVRRRLARLFIRTGDLDAAFVELELCRTLAPDATEELVLLADVASRLGRREDAARYYHALCPGVPQTREELRWLLEAATLELRLGNDRAAELCFRRAVQSPFAHAEIRARLAVLLLTKGRLDEAAATFAQAARDQGGTQGHDFAGKLIRSHLEFRRHAYLTVPDELLSDEDRELLGLVRSLVEQQTIEAAR